MTIRNHRHEPCWYCPLVWVIIVLAFIGFWATVTMMLITGPAEAQQPYEPWGTDYESHPELWYENAEEGLAHFGIIMYWNQQTADSGPDTYALTTPHGDVVIQLHHTSNIDCAVPCPDLFEIYGLPNGVVAETTWIEGEEGKMYSIKLYKYLGG